MKYLAAIFSKIKSWFLPLSTYQLSFNPIEYLQDGSGRIAMSQISFKYFIGRLNKKHYELWLTLPNGGTIWVYYFLEIRYEKPSHLIF